MRLRVRVLPLGSTHSNGFLITPRAFTTLFYNTFSTQHEVHVDTCMFIEHLAQTYLTDYYPVYDNICQDFHNNIKGFALELNPGWHKMI